MVLYDLMMRITHGGSVQQRFIVTACVILLSVVCAGVFWGSLDDLEMMNRFVIRIESMGTLGFLMIALIYCALALLPIPLMPLSALGGYLMGFWTGLAWLYPAAVVSACLSHYVGQRYLVTAVPMILVRFPKARFLCDQAVKGDWVAVAANRLLPVCPFAIQNVLLGAIGLRIRAQCVGTAIGILPALGFAIYCGSIAQALTQVLGQPEQIMPAGRIILLLVSAVVGLLVLIWMRRTLMEHRAELG